MSREELDALDALESYREFLREHEEAHWRDEEPSDEDWHREQIEIHPERYR